MAIQVERLRRDPLGVSSGMLRPVLIVSKFTCAGSFPGRLFRAEARVPPGDAVGVLDHMRRVRGLPDVSAGGMRLNTESNINH